MNRDESRARDPEWPPERLETPGNGIAWVGPRDSAAGGTWMGASERGVVACLLNNYQRQAVVAPGKRSRGAIIPDALDQGDLGDVFAWLAEDFDPAPYAPFTLLVAGPDDARSFDWGGEGHLETAPIPAPWAMFTSSSWKGPEVLAWRRERYEEWLRDGAERDPANSLPTFQKFQPEGRAKWSPLMSREATHTRSVTLAEVDANRGSLSLKYWPDPAAELTEPSCVEALELTPAPSRSAAH
jgi:hypothetical protein